MRTIIFYLIINFQTFIVFGQTEVVFETIIIDEYDLNIEIPSQWRNRVNSNSQPFFICKKNCVDTLVFCPNFVLVYDTIPNNISFDQYIDLSLEYLSNKFSDAEMTEINTGMILPDKLFAGEFKLNTIDGLQLFLFCGIHRKDKEIIYMTGISSQSDIDLIRPVYHRSIKSIGTYSK